MADAPAGPQAPRQPVLDLPYRPPLGEPEVAHEDEAVLVLVKPAGLLCAPGKGDDKQDCLVARARARWPGARLVHRLDLATSGLVLLALSAPVLAALSAAFRDRRVAKAYQARVHGPLPAASGTIDLPLAADWPRRPLQKVCHDTGRPSVTRWHRLTSDAATGLDRVALEPVTGRTHQLRVHLAALGCPIQGDPLYGRPGDEAPRLMLHATGLAFAHPVDGRSLDVRSPAPF